MQGGFEGGVEVEGGDLGGKSGGGGFDWREGEKGGGKEVCGDFVEGFEVGHCGWDILCVDWGIGGLRFWVVGLATDGCLF